MKHDVTTIVIKHITELYQILDKYNVFDKSSLVLTAENDLVFQKAVLMTVGYIGELSKKLDENIKKSAPELNWRRLSVSRNIIFHDYDIVDMEIISSVIFKDILSLMTLLSGETNGLKEFYNATAHEWADKWYSDETMLPLIKKFIDLFNTKPCILDAGCGAGYESMRLANLGADVTGIDISEKCIEIARLRNPDCCFELMDCKKLDKNLGLFNGIACIALIVHIQDCDLKLIFDNFKEVIKSEGFLFVAFAEGDGFDEKRSYVEINGEKYNRAFYLHKITRIIEIAKESGFKYSDEWFLDKPNSEWRYLIFQAI